jgi:uncharacterized cupin superfamily protein
MDQIIHTNRDKLAPVHQSEHPPYEFFRYEAAGVTAGNQCAVNIYDLPPGKSNFPYHYHSASEEIFYIISGQGVLRTPEGEKKVKAGDVIIFPPSEKGAHKLTNTSDTELLQYLDVDTVRTPEVVGYPDSRKVGVISRSFRMVFKEDTAVGYYKDE